MKMLRACLLAAAVVGVFGDTVNVGCDPGWYPNAGYCYLFNTKTRVTRSQASDECDNFMGNLLRVESDGERAFLQNSVSQFTTDGFWTDMSDLRFDGTGTGTGVWMWGGYEKVNMSTIQWETYPTGNVADSCGAVNIQGLFQNWKCNRRLGYICEADIGNFTGCPFGWLMPPNRCFLFSNTSDPTQLLTWNNAKAACAAKTIPGSQIKAKLVTLDTTKDAAYIVNQMPKVANTTTMFWTGLKKTATAWTWDSGDPFTAGYFTWAKEPDHINNNEHCAILKPDGKFSDQDCSKQMNYACRIGTTTRDIMTGATCGAGDAHSSGTPDLAFGFCEENTDYYMGCNGWNRAGHKCYQIYDGPKSSWADAKSKCASLNSKLLEVQSLDERDWIEWQLTDESHPNFYWSGLNDQGKEGSYRWADGTQSNSSLIRWNQEPNSWNGDEDCAGIQQTGFYNDADCFLHFPAICEYRNMNNGGLCSTGWIVNAASNDCYYVTALNQTYTWDEANTFCSKTMAQSSTVPTTLLAVNSLAEMNFVKQMVAGQPTFPGTWWTGLNDVKNEGIWTYPDQINRPPNMAAIKWNGEPSDTNASKNCVMLGWGGRYFDVQCTNKMGFICEKRPFGYNKAGQRTVSSVLMALAVTIAFILH